MRATHLGIAALIALISAGPAVAADAQTFGSQPDVSAAATTWYRSGEPIPIGDALYYQSGPIVFFDANTMILSGMYEGVPLYTDTTREPFSFVLVPIGGGQMRPYERRRSGELSGTTGSMAPSLPVAPSSTTSLALQAAGPPTRAYVNPLAPINAPALPAGPAPQRATEEANAVGTTGPPAQTEAPRPQYVPHTVATLRVPESNDGIWIGFQGAKWVAAGPAVPLDHTQFVSIGTYAGFPVFARVGDREPQIVFLPSRAGLVAPYRRR